MVKDSQSIDVAETGAALSEAHWRPADRPQKKDAVREEELVQACAKRLDDVNESYPDWFAYFDDVQAMSAQRVDITELLRCAPTEFTRGLMYGIYLMRCEMALISGREFN